MISIKRKKKLLKNIVKILNIKQIEKLKISCFFIISIILLNLTNLYYIFLFYNLFSNTKILLILFKNKILNYIKIKYKNKWEIILTI